MFDKIYDNEKHYLDQCYAGDLPDGAYIGSIYSESDSYEAVIYSRQGFMLDSFDIPKGDAK